MKLTAKALAAVLPCGVKNAIDHDPADKALAEEVYRIVFPFGGFPEEARFLDMAASIARDFRLIVAEIEKADAQ